MGIWKNLFKRGEEPELQIVDNVLGELTWNEDRESWDGLYNGIRFGVSYEYEKFPKKETVDHARKIVLDENWTTDAIARIKEMALAEYPASYREEISTLTIRTLCFFDHERLHIQMFDNDDEPWWFAEAMNGNIIHVGFDT